MYQIWDEIHSTDENLQDKIGSQSFNILIYLAAYADQYGYCYLSYDEIAKKFKIPIKVVKENIYILSHTLFDGFPVLSRIKGGFKLNIGISKKGGKKFEGRTMS